ncbi:hypothetical protein LY78DRAFT_655617 [Colletotrichum sublineola]|nr:hypothetical protein LY78DRAFT_655617 [Colletotrichum sublineola]
MAQPKSTPTPNPRMQLLATLFWVSCHTTGDLANLGSSYAAVRPRLAMETGWAGFQHTTASLRDHPPELDCDHRQKSLLFLVSACFFSSSTRNRF